MKETWLALLRSKRAIVVSITVSICAAFVLAGRMPVSDFIVTVERLGALLAALFGIENIAAAVAPVVTVHNHPPKPPVEIPVAEDTEPPTPLPPVLTGPVTTPRNVR